MYFFLLRLLFFHKFFFKGEQKKRDYLERRLSAVCGKQFTAELREWARRARAGHIGSAVAWGRVRMVRDGAGRCGRMRG